MWVGGWVLAPHPEDPAAPLCRTLPAFWRLGRVTGQPRGVRPALCPRPQPPRGPESRLPPPPRLEEGALGGWWGWPAGLGGRPRPHRGLCCARPRGPQVDGVSTARPGAEEGTGPEPAAQEALPEHQLWALPSAALLPSRCPRARPGRVAALACARPLLAASPAQPSGTGRSGALQGRPTPTWSKHLECRWGNWAPVRGPQRSGRCSWSGCSPMASLPWPRCAPGVQCGHQRGAPEGSRSGAGPSCRPRGSAGGHPFGSVRGRWACVPGCGAWSVRGGEGKVTEPQAPAHRDGPWQTMRTKVLRGWGAGGQSQVEPGEEQASENPTWTSGAS